VFGIISSVNLVLSLVFAASPMNSLFKRLEFGVGRLRVTSVQTVHLFYCVGVIYSVGVAQSL
jgi:fumarate reductase subunit D